MRERERARARETVEESNRAQGIDCRFTFDFDFRTLIFVAGNDMEMLEKSAENDLRHQPLILSELKFSFIFPISLR